MINTMKHIKLRSHIKKIEKIIYNKVHKNK